MSKESTLLNLKLLHLSLGRLLLLYTGKEIIGECTEELEIYSRIVCKSKVEGEKSKQVFVNSKAIHTIVVEQCLKKKKD